MSDMLIGGHVDKCHELLDAVTLQSATAPTSITRHDNAQSDTN